MMYWAAVVDDDLLNQKAAEKILGLHGFRVSCLCSGEELLSFVKENQPDIILLDLHMEGIDGFETLRQLKMDEQAKEIPVIVLTADSDEDSEVKALVTGAADFVAKPFAPSVLLMRVQNTIDLARMHTDLKQEVQRATEKMQREHERNERLSLQIVQTLADTIDAKDSYTKGHSNRVAGYAREIARRAGYSQKMQDDVYMMGLLHDVGKIGIPDTLLSKPGSLTEEEYALIQTHVSVGYDILQNITEMPKLALGARWHHERFDGTGYPDKLRGRDIPEEARILSVADAYDAMSSRRSYHDVFSQHYIINEIETGKATQFDPGYADIMLQMIAEDRDYTMREHFENEQKKPQKQADASMSSIFKMLEANGVHTQNGMRYCMDDAEMYLEMLKEFMHSADMRIEKLRFSFQNMDHPQYHNTVHALKSAAKTIGADQLSALAAEMEDAVKHNQIDYISAHQGELVEKLIVTVSGIQAAMESHG